MNKQLKKLALAVTLIGAIIAGFGGVAFAHGGKHHRGVDRAGMFERFANLSEEEKLEKLEAHLDKRVEKMTARLDLDAAQQVKVRQIFADAQTQLIELYEKNKDVEDKTQARAEARTIFKASRAEVEQVLTAEQLAKAKELKAQRKAKRGKKFKNGEFKKGEFKRGGGAR